MQTNYRRNNTDKTWAFLTVIYSFKLKAYAFGPNIFKLVKVQELLTLKGMLQIFKSISFKSYYMTTYLSEVKTSLAMLFKVTVLANPLPAKMWSTSFITVPQVS